ncbi:MAG: class I SAM-dependent RNA methyltransferase [Bacteroidales bacterium]|nr:class I SAM-dependent RNA methyltransferase [Bacteroidales bacterium]
MGRKKKYPLIGQLEITDIGAEGKSLGKHEGMVVFVPQVIPGDVVDVQINQKKKRYMEGYVVNYHKFSDLRIKPFCEHFGVCGGCKWQHLPYSHQLHFKQKQVVDHLTRIGKVELPEINPIVPSDNQMHYRNKLEYAFSENRWLSQEEVNAGEQISDRNALGFHIPGRFDRVLEINACYLQPDPSDQIRGAVKEYSVRNNLRYFDLVKQEGFLRNLIIRNNKAGEFMVVVSFFENREKEITGLLEFLKNTFPQITSLLYVFNPKANDTINDLEIKLYSGKGHITESLEDLHF